MKNYLKLKGFFKHDDLLGKSGIHKGLLFFMLHPTFRTSPLPFLLSFLGLFGACNGFL